MSENTFKVSTKFGAIEILPMNDVPGGGLIIFDLGNTETTGAAFKKILELGSVTAESTKALNALDGRRMAQVVNKYKDWNEEYEANFTFDEDDL